MTKPKHSLRVRRTIPPVSQKVAPPNPGFSSPRVNLRENGPRAGKGQLQKETRWLQKGEGGCGS